MIRTQDLEEYVKETTTIIKKLKGGCGITNKTNYIYEEYRAEIVARLRAYDKLLKCPEPKSTAIDTRALIAYIRKGNKSVYISGEQYEYSEQIVARRMNKNDILQGYNCPRMSNGVDR